MKNKYITLKLDKKEIEALKYALSGVIIENICEKNKPDFEEKVKEDYEKYNKLHREANNCKRILEIINYLER